MLIASASEGAQDSLTSCRFSRRQFGQLALGAAMAPAMGWAADRAHLVASRDSYADFVQTAWTYFNTPSMVLSSDADMLNALYGYAAGYNPNHIPEKKPLAGTALNRAMAAFIQATAPHTIRAQQGNWPDITAQVDELSRYYTAKANGVALPPDELAEDITQDYLHIYPRQPQARTNWRIGLNVLPSDMAAAMAALAPMLNTYACIGHMKFLCPGNADKADSMIVYCVRDDNNDYASLERAVLRAAADLNLQPRVGAMWEEIRPGIGVASEPPMDGVSFTQFRCLIVYLAFKEYVAVKHPDLSFAGFRDFLADALPIFGLDASCPYQQGPLQKQSPHFAEWWDGLEMLRRSWTG